MKFQRIQFPGNTLIVSSIDFSYTPFVLHFLKLWKDKFIRKADLALPQYAETGSALIAEFAESVALPRNFFPLLLFLRSRRYKTVVFLNPDPKADRALKWATRLLFVKHRAGFAPLKGFHTLNYSLPFNKENHHFVHQLKIFFEYLIGEKVSLWDKPQVEVIPDKNIPAENFAVLAIDVTETATAHLTVQLQKFINIAARNLRLVLMISERAAADTSETPTAQFFARTLSDTMTEHAVKMTELMVNPPMEKKLAFVREAVWVAGTDAEALNLAGLMGVANLSLFGPLNERVWQPFSTRSRVLAGDFSCRPCTEFPGKITCKNPQEWQCMSGVTGELMAATLTGMLQRRQSPTQR